MKSISRRKLLTTSAGMIALPISMSVMAKEPQKRVSKKNLPQHNKWIVGQFGGKYGANIDVSDAFNKTIIARGDSKGDVLFPFVDGIIFVGENSLVIPEDITIDFGGNTVKLMDSASKYLLMNSKKDESISGEIIIKNAIFDGNKRGNQVRRYDNSYYDDRYGDIYSFENNYPGFCLLFHRISRLSIFNVKVIDSEGWSIAHFLCDTAIFKNIEFDTSEGYGVNADGITGVGTKRTIIDGVSGYTNDDMVAISTSRATVDQKNIFNPKLGRNLDVFSARNIYSENKNGGGPFVGVGIYYCDDFIINSVCIGNVFGKFTKHVARVGNYWGISHYFGVIDFVVNNIYASSMTPGFSDFHFFSGWVKRFMMNGGRSYKSSFGGYEIQGSSIINVTDGRVKEIKVRDVTFYNNSLLTDGESIIRISQGGSVDVIEAEVTIDLEETLPEMLSVLIKESGATGSTIINIASINFEEKLSIKNIFRGEKIIIGDVFNVKLSEKLAEGADIIRHGKNIYLSGNISVPSSNDFHINLPSWAISNHDFRHSVFFEKNKKIIPGIINLNSSGKVNIISNSSVNGSMLMLDGVNWLA